MECASVTVEANADTVNGEAVIAHNVNTVDPDYAMAARRDVYVTEIDLEAPGIVVDPLSLSVEEGGTTTYTIKLSAAPAVNKSVIVELSVNTPIGLPNPVTITSGGNIFSSRAEVVFGVDNWDIEKSITVRAAEGDEMPGIEFFSDMAGMNPLLKGTDRW